jgi:tellurite resistance protein TehA-like permease
MMVRTPVLLAIIAAYGVGFWLYPVITAGILVVDVGSTAYLLRSRARASVFVAFGPLGIPEEE